MNIHEHQAKDLIKKFGAPVSKGVVIFNLNEIDEKIKQLNSKMYVVKAQIHAGGRGKAGGVKLVKNIDELKQKCKDLLGKVLITHQTGPQGREVKRLYIEEASDIKKEFYLSCLVDRASSKIAFISSAEGGMDVEEVADKTPEKIKQLNSKMYVVKAQIHAGGRGKAGGVKLVKNIDELKQKCKDLLGKVLITHQTGPQGREVKRLYIEEASDIKKEFYLSCLVDRASSKIAFISSAEGGMDVEEVADKTPEKIITTRVSLSAKLRDEDLESIVKPYNLSGDQKNQAKKVAQALYDTLINTDGSLIEINPLILTTEDQIKCLDAKISFDDNALFRHSEIKELRDLNEEDPMEIEASKYELAYIKLDGKIGCMVNGAGLAMATMDIIKLYGSEPANFLDVGGGATKEKVSAAFKIILSDKNVEGILINIFGGIMRCDIIAQGVIEAAKEVDLKVPLVVRLAGTKVDEGKEILKKSGLTIISADNLSEAAKKIVEATS